MATRVQRGHLVTCGEGPTTVYWSTESIVFAVGRCTVACGNDPAHLRVLGQSVENAPIRRPQHRKGDGVIDPLALPFAEGRPDSLGKIVAVTSRFRYSSFKPITQWTDDRACQIGSEVTDRCTGRTAALDWRDCRTRFGGVGKRRKSDVFIAFQLGLRSRKKSDCSQVALHRSQCREKFVLFVG